MITTQNDLRLLSRTLNETETEHVFLRSRKRWIAVLYVSATLGSLAGLLGLGLSAASLFIHMPAFAAAVSAAPLMLAASFPLLIFAAHCLDKVAEAEKRVKLEFLRRMGGEDLTER